MLNYFDNKIYICKVEKNHCFKEKTYVSIVWIQTDNLNNFREKKMILSYYPSLGEKSQERSVQNFSGGHTY